MKYGQLDIAHRRRSHRIFEDILRAYSNSSSPRILDVGCAFGVIGALRGNSVNIYGIERDPKLLRLAQKNCQKVYQLDLNDPDLNAIKESGFDFIFCGDIVEHVIAPCLLLKNLQRLLSPQGYLVISVPNIAQLPYRIRLFLGNFDYQETGVLDRTHLHLYTYKTALALIEGSGFEIVKFFPSGTIVSYVNIFPNLLASQFIFLCKKRPS